ncbi:hypothetical protein ACFZCK_15325 [Kitasatospora purpeofusca]|uniref:hypothetical protein n=1 Tax=Kitasatospora purpeofusca TaxID=67352 RepID=UPI0036E6A8A3
MLDLATVRATDLPVGSSHSVHGVVLVLLGLLAAGLGILWAIDFGGMVTRRHDQQRVDRERLPPALRTISPVPLRPAVQRLTGVLLAAVGFLLVLTGAGTFLP